MSKIYKGWELMKAIADGEIKEGSKIKMNEDIFIFYEGNFMSDSTVYYLKNIYDDIIFATAKFELIEDGIDIDNIEEFEIVGCNIKFNDTLFPTESIINDMILDKMNKLVQAVKQIDKRVKKLEN